jgi:RND family efflux transporter MFP subunit
MNDDHRSHPAGRMHNPSAIMPWIVLALTVMAPAFALADDTGIKADVSACLLRPRHLVQLGSPVFGLLTGVFVDRAETVKEGQVIAKLDTTVEEMQLALDRFRATNTTSIDAAQADMDLNRRELARLQKLAGNMFSRANDVDTYATKVEQDRIAIRKAQSDLDIAKREADRSQAQLDLKILRSPVNGVITEIKLSPGEFIYETTPIMTIAQVDPLMIDLVVPSDRYHSVKVGMIGEVHLNQPIDQTLPARVDAIDPVVDPASDTFRVRLLLPNPGNAIPAGIRCSVNLPDASTGE